MAPFDFTDPATVGWTFIVIGIGFYLVEATVPGFFLGVPATILLLLGILSFVAPEIALSPTYAPLIVVVVGIPATLGTIWAYRRMAPPTETPYTLTGDKLVGTVGTVTRAVEPGNSRGKVRIQRQIWSATADTVIPEGAEVRVTAVDGVILTVIPAAPQGGP
ncbi:MAG TPA: NfeD family protein [Candidatus Thermoplasmatota archaeon]|nr:NfeD family protein [Candidatus Thermoplasmatota archaeon]